MQSPNNSSYQNPQGFEVDFDLLQEFESQVDPIQPESCAIPCKVLGFGEISTIFEIQAEGMDGLAFKRMSIFEDADEMDDYLEIFQAYNRILEEDIDISLPVQGHASFVNEKSRPIFYIIQEKLDAHAIGSQAIHLLPREGTLMLIKRALYEMHKIWKYNRSQGDCQVGIDGQISNWVAGNFDPETASIDLDTPLAYIDTSTPLFRLNGVEQLNPELFLRSAPSFMVWVLRMFFVDEVVDRYYDFRKVVIDLLANFYKEQRADLIPDLIALCNNFFSEEAADLEIEPIEEKEVRSYYREDALIWWLYLSMRRFDRLLHQYVLRRDYPYILPGKIKR